MDLGTLSALAEQLAPLVVQKIKGKGKKEVSELTTVGDYENVRSLPAWYWNKQTGEKKAVNVSMSEFEAHIEAKANAELVEIKAAARDAQAAAEEANAGAAEAERKAAEAAEAALEQKRDTEVYLDTIRANEAERQANEEGRVTAEEERSSAWSAWFDDAAAGVKAIWAGWYESIKAAWSAFNAGAEEAETGRATAERERVNAEEARVEEFASLKTESESATHWAELSAEKSDQVRLATQQQTDECKLATELATVAYANPPRINDQGYWEVFDPQKGELVPTESYALGGATYPVFGVDEDGFAYVESTDDDSGRFDIDGEGFLVVNF